MSLQNLEDIKAKKSGHEKQCSIIASPITMLKGEKVIWPGVGWGEVKFQNTSEMG